MKQAVGSEESHGPKASCNGDRPTGRVGTELDRWTYAVMLHVRKKETAVGTQDRTHRHTQDREPFAVWGPVANNQAQTKLAELPHSRKPTPGWFSFDCIH